LLPVGRGDSEDLCVTKEEQYAALNKIFSWQVKHPEIRFNVHDPLYGTILHDHFINLTTDEDVIYWMKSFSCRAGTKWIGINPEGNVSPCPLLLYKDLLIGNIFDDSIEKIMTESPIIKKFQRAASRSSNSCKYGSFCLGCRATAIGKGNDCFSKDPMCVHPREECPIGFIDREDDL
jgi:radical SAM protein with 4Fe4S-binding SPASM domain